MAFELKIDTEQRLAVYGLNSKTRGVGDDARAAVVAALDKFEAEAIRATQIGKDYLAGVRASKQWEILSKARAALDAALAAIKEPEIKAFVKADEAVDKVREGETPATEVGRLLQFQRRVELRQQMRGMAKDARRVSLLEASKAGDGEPWRAAREAFDPLFSGDILHLAENAYLVAAAPGELEIRAIHKACLDGLELFIAMAGRAADRIVRNTKGILPQPPLKSNLPGGMTAPQKSAFIAEHGQEAFESLVLGKLSPGAALVDRGTAPAGGEAA